MNVRHNSFSIKNIFVIKWIYYGFFILMRRNSLTWSEQHPKLSNCLFLLERFFYMIFARHEFNFLTNVSFVKSKVSCKNKFNMLASILEK